MQIILSIVENPTQEIFLHRIHELKAMKTLSVKLTDSMARVAHTKISEFFSVRVRIGCNLISTSEALLHYHAMTSDGFDNITVALW